MLYRKLGKTELSVSEIGLGCEHLDGKPYEQTEQTINEAIENGINIFDVFMPGKEIRENITKALGEKRKNIFIQGHIGSADINQQYDISRDMPVVKQYFEDLLRLFGGYIDLGMMFFIDTEKDYKDVFETDFINYVQFLKKEGYIRHIGFSSHNPVTAIKVIQTGVPEMLMFSINPAFDMLPCDEYIFDHFEKDFGVGLFNGIDPVRAELYKLCEQKKIGITVMKALGGGKLISAEHTPFDKPMTIPQCVHYALSRPAVSSVLLGAKTQEEMRESLRYFELSDNEKDYAAVLSSTKKDFKANCVYCGHCQPCPSEIDIASLTKYLDIALLDRENIPPSIKSHYLNLLHHANECVECGNCEARCPFGVGIIKNMQTAQALFGK